MATAIGLSMQLSASTSGLNSGLSEADKLINKLGRGAESAAKYFDTFRDATTGELPAAMQAIVDRAGELATSFREGKSDSEVFASGISEISSQASSLTKAFQEGAAVTKQFATEQENSAERVNRLGQLLEKGAISQKTYDRAVAEASGANAAAAKSAKERADAEARAAQITQQNLSPVQRYDKVITELEGHLKAGRISQETFNSAVSKAEQDLNKATGATKALGAEAEKAGLKFNELSGVFGLLPGPIGSVASRVSSLASAGEGLSKVFSGGGGLSGGLSAIAGSVTSLINPFTLAAAGAAAFGAAAAAVASGLNQLQDRVEKLGNQADKLGASFEFIQVLETAAERGQSSLEALGGGFNRFLKALDGAKSGEKKAVEAFSNIGISAEDLQKKTPEEIFKQLATGITAIEDPAQRAATAIAIFGRSGADLIPTFKSIAGAEADLKRYLATLSDLDKARLTNFTNSVNALKTATRGLGQSILLPFTGLGDGIARGVAEFTGGITAIVKPIGQILEPVLTQIGRFIETFLAGIGAVGRTIGAILAPFGEVFEAISAAVAPAYDAIFGFFTFIQDGAVAAVEAIMKFTLIGVIAENIDAITAAVQPFISAFVDGLGFAIETVQRLAAIVSAAFEQVAAVIGQTIGRAVETVGVAISTFLEFTGLSSVVSGALDFIGQSFAKLWDTIKGIIVGIGGFIEQVLSFAESWLGITREIETPVQAEIQLDTEEPSRAAEQFYKEITKATEATKDLGQEGFEATLKYQESLRVLADLAAEGELSEEELRRAVANTTAEFENSIRPLQEAQKEREKAAKAAEDAAKRQIEADRRIADQAIEAQRVETEFGGSKERAKAAEQLLAINREIEQVQAEQAKAAEANDKAAASAAAARLAALDQAKAAVAETAEFGFNQADVDRAIKKVREDIVGGIAEVDFELAPDAAEEFFENIKELERQLDLKLIDPKQFEEAAKAAQKNFQEAKKQAEKVRDLQVKYAEEAAKIQKDRLEELGRASQQALRVDDVRTSAGASEFLRLATGREDPAIAEYKKQLKKLEEIKREIAKASQQPVEMI